MTRDEVGLRRIESADELAAANELAREFGDWATERIKVELGIVVPPEADHPAEVLDELLASGGRLYVAEVAGVAVGVGGLKRLDDTAGEIKRMFVRPTARGLGVGRALVERLIDDARTLGFETIYLESASFMHSAHALYRSVGFVPSGPYAGREFEGVAHDVSILMRLDLAIKSVPYLRREERQMAVEEASLEETPFGRHVTSEGWFVVNLSDALAVRNVEKGGAMYPLEGRDVHFGGIGVNVRVVWPGDPSALYHSEGVQEGFLVLSGACTLIVNDEERPLRQWDYFHCPADTPHVIVGAGDGPCAILMVGARPDKTLFYPVSEVAAKYGASAAKATGEPDEAYADWPGEYEPVRLPWPLDSGA